jgi:tripartite-type tricarboxylate transporter receptor subunit TctC
MIPACFRSCLGVALAFFATGAVADPIADFYAGKQMTLIVGSDPGGGYDAQARLVARQLGRFIPGNPLVTVQNLPGAGGILATNRVCSTAPQDGTVIGLVQRGVLLAPLTQQSGIHCAVDKINWIGNVSAEVSVALAWHDAPVQTIDALRQRDLIVGGTGAAGDAEASARLLNAIMGTHFKIVTGYAGTADIALAMERGEVQGIADWPWSSVKATKADWLRDRKITLLMQIGPEKAADLPDVPLAIDYVTDPVDRQVAQLYVAMKKIARPILAGPLVPSERVAALRKAFLAMAEDPQFLDDAKKAKLDVSPTSYEPIDQFVALVAATPSDLAARLTTILNPVKP